MYFVFDVESIGLSGEGFQVGVVVLSEDGTIHDEFLCQCHPNMAEGSPDGRTWVNENVPLGWIPTANLHSTMEVRNAFWAYWELCSTAYPEIKMVADVPFPVETNFLKQCLQDNYKRKSPYPLLDVTSMLLCKGFDPFMNHERLPNELPKHHALMDARQSARLLLQCLGKMST